MWCQPMTDIFDGKHNLQIHIKFADEWLMMAEMDNVHGEELLGAVSNLSKKLADGLEKYLTSGEMGKLNAGVLGENGLIKGKSDEV